MEPAASVQGSARSAPDRDAVQTQRLEGLVAVVAEVGAAGDLETALSALTRGAVTLLGGHQGAIRVYDAGDVGRHLAYWMQPNGVLEAADHPDPPPGSVAAALRAGGPARLIEDLWLLDPDASPLYAELRRRGMRSSVAVPIVAAAPPGDAGPAGPAGAGNTPLQRIGSLHVDHREVGFFGKEDLALAEALAKQAGAAVDRARLAEAQRRATEGERERARLDGALLVARTVAHEVNNALAPIGGFAELLAIAPAVARDPTLAAYATLIVQAVENAAGKVRQLNRIVRLEESDIGLGSGQPVLDLDRSTDSGTQ